jgi:signal transduction histidine kinase
MRIRKSHVALIAFFAGLAALEVAHGASRLAAVRERRAEELRVAARAAHRELALDLRTALGAEGRHVSYLAKSPAVRAAAVTRAADDRKRVEAQLLAYLAAFEAFDAVRLLDPHGAEIVQVRRIGGGVGALPEGLLAPKADAETAAVLAAIPPGDGGLAGFAYDAARVEVPERDRQVAHYVARSAGDAVLVLTVFVSPTLNRVRRFSPAPGAHALLVDGEGRYLAAADRDRERNGPREGVFSRDFPAAASLLAAADAEADLERGALYSTAVADSPPLRLVTVLDEGALADAAAEAVRGEYVRIVAGTLGVTAVLVAALFYLLRLAERASRLRETELELRESERRRALEQRLASAERLSALGLLTAGVAHEINNPLEGIGNYLVLLDRAGDDPEKRRRYLEAIRHGFDRIRNLVRDLLNFGRPGVAAGSCDAGRAVARALDLARLGKDGRGVEFRAEGFDAPAPVACDAGRLEQVFLNLLLNASKAIKAAGRETGAVAVRAAATRLEDGRAGYDLIVEDDGPGIPAEHLSKLFDPFFTTGGGSGLGLAVTHGIVRAHGGAVLAENRPGGGARFIVRLPAADAGDGVSV